MKGSLAAKRYAKSLMDLAIERKMLDAIYSDMVVVADTVADNHDLKLLLNNPIVKSDKKKSILDAIFSKSTNPLTLEFFKLIASRGREELVGEIAQSFVVEYKRHKKIAVAEAFSATQLDQKQRDAIVKLLAEDGVDSVEITEKIDPSLIGGFIVRIGDKQIDQSVARKLSQLKQELS